MKVRDPKRIIMPGENPNVDMAVQEMRAKEAMEHNPLFQMLQSVQTQLGHALTMQQILLVRLQALTEYMVQAGLLLDQTLDDTGKPISAPFLPEAATANPGWKENEMPKYGYTTYFAEYSIRTKLVASLMAAHDKKQLTYQEVIGHVRAFNNEPDRLLPIKGNEFGLVEYLSTNPDKLEDAELDAIAHEFGLRKEVENDEAGTPEAPAEL